MSQLSVILPAQRKSYKEKAKEDFKWAKECIDAVALRMYQYNSNDNTGYYSDIARKLVNYRLYNNELDQNDFERECNPYNIKAEEFIEKIQPYNKIPNKVNVLLGEELKRPFNFKVFLLNDSAVNAYTRAKKELNKRYIKFTLDQEIAKYKAQLAQEMGDPQSEEEANQFMEQLQAEVDKIVTPEMMDKYLSTEWRDGVEIMMDQLLQWFNRKLRVRSLKNDGFKHALISGEEHVWVGVINGEPTIKVLNPVKTFYHKSSEVSHVQDGFYAGYRTRMTAADCLTEFGDDLTDEQKEKIDSYTAMSSLYGMTDEIINKEINLLDLNKSLEWRLGKGAGTMITVGSYGPSTLNDLDVVHVEWRSQRKFGFLTSLNDVDEKGDPMMDLMDESFKVPDTATKVRYTDKYGNQKTKYTWIVDDQAFELEWVWLPEVWEGTRIAYDIYVNVRPKPYQQRSLKEPYKVKLGYHGLAYNSMNASSISLVDRGKPFQYLYFILLHKMKEVIAKDMPPLTMIDMSMIPKTLTNEQWLYYYKQGLGFYDPNQNNEGNPSNISGQKGPAFEVQRSAMQHVNNYIEILAWVDNQINEVMGITKQREGQTAQYETATNAQQNIVQSNNITEILFQAHNNLWEQVLTSLIETAQLCYKDDPKRIPVVLDDLSRQIIEIHPDDIADIELGAFISDGVNDSQNLEQLRQMALTFAQNKHSMPEIINLFQATSMSQLKRESEVYEKMKQRMAQAQEEAQRQHEQLINQANIEAQDRQHQYRLEEIDRKGMWDLRKAELTSLGIDEGGNSETILAEAELALKHAETTNKLTNEQRKLANEERSQQFEEIKQAQELQERDKDRQLEREKIKSQEKVARMKPKPTAKKK
jgi:hypothetical protein